MSVWAAAGWLSLCGSWVPQQFYNFFCGRWFSELSPHLHHIHTACIPFVRLQRVGSLSSPVEMAACCVRGNLPLWALEKLLFVLHSVPASASESASYSHWFHFHPNVFMLVRSCSLCWNAAETEGLCGFWWVADPYMLLTQLPVTSFAKSAETQSASPCGWPLDCVCGSEHIRIICVSAEGVGSADPGWYPADRNPIFPSFLRFGVEGRKVIMERGRNQWCLKTHLLMWK